MQQKFDTRKYSVRDFEEWNEKGELELAPKFQRRDVWSMLARSFLIDTIIRGKPIPKLYMRQEINPKTRRTRREVVDGQQRLRTVLLFLEDGFKISKTHNEQFGGKFYSELEEDTQKDILKYEFAVDLLQDMPDQEVYDIFARLNSYSMVLNYQELRHAIWFGEFKTSIYNMANEYTPFWTANKILNDKNIMRMAEAEFVSELFIAMVGGIRAKEKKVIDNYYRDLDKNFPQRRTIEERFRETIDHVAGIMGDTLITSNFRSTRLFYPLYCAIFHMQYGLPKFEFSRHKITPSDYPKIKVALGEVDDIIERKAIADEESFSQNDMEGSIGGIDEENIKSMDEQGEFSEDELREQEEGREEPLHPDEIEFYNAYNEHWVHAENRQIMTKYICYLIERATKNQE